MSQFASAFRHCSQKACIALTNRSTRMECAIESWHRTLSTAETPIVPAVQPPPQNPKPNSLTHRPDGLRLVLRRAAFAAGPASQTTGAWDSGIALESDSCVPDFKVNLSRSPVCV